MAINAPDTSSADKHIERLTDMRENLDSLAQGTLMYDKLKEKYLPVLEEFQKELNDRLGAYLLAKHDQLNPPSYRVVANGRPSGK